MTAPELVTEIAIYEEDVKEEKTEIISSMLAIQFFLFLNFVNNKYYEKAKNYINEYYKKILDETEFEHLTYIKIKKYISSFENITDIINPIVLDNISVIFEEFDNRVDYRLNAFAQFEQHCKELIKSNILTNSNYLFLNYPENTEEYNEYIRCLIPREEKDDANKNK